MNLLTRGAIEQHERTTLAPWAARSADSLGRVYEQDEHPLRTAYQRDRDRIVHAAAFRRMEYKTQVFIPHEQDHFRTRLTHTIEVAQIGRTLARNLRLNEDLTEAVALVHDLGHTPFGHAGEDVLNHLLSDHGGFNHNRQSLRVVDILEQRYPNHPGLNLSYEVREGIAKHETTVQMSVPEFDRFRNPTLEASLVDIADEIAYNAHDIDDGIASGLINYEQVMGSKFIDDLLVSRPSGLNELNEDYQRYAMVRGLINRCATDVITETADRVEQAGVETVADVRQAETKLAGFSADLSPAVRELKTFLRDELYRHPKLQTLSRQATDIIEGIFSRLSDDPSLMPERFQEMLDDQPREIVIADYIAGMTDRYAERVARRLSVI